MNLLDKEEMECPYCRHVAPISSFYQMMSGKSAMDFSCPQCGKEIDLKTVANIVSEKSRKFGSNYTSQRSAELTEKERTGMFWQVTTLDFTLFIIFYAVLCFFFPMKDISWVFLIIIFIVSRLADMISTFIGLSAGATETNPLSDPHDISKLLLPQIFQVGVIIFFSFLLGLITPWLRNGLLFIFSLLGFCAASANSMQAIMGPIALPSASYFDSSISSSLLFLFHIISFVILAIITVVLSIVFL